MRFRRSLKNLSVPPGFSSGETATLDWVNQATRPPFVARVNFHRANRKLSNANLFTHGTHDRNLNSATPAEAEAPSHEDQGRRT